MDEQRDAGGREPHVWAPPDAGAAADAAVGRTRQPASGADPAGPPPPPWERQRRRRRGWLLGIAVAVALMVTVGLGLAGLIPAGEESPEVATEDAEGEVPEGEAPEGEAPEGEAPEGEAPEGEDPGPDDGEPLDVPDLDRLEGPDAVFAQLLIDIDASEQEMLAFQRELVGVFQEHGLGDDIQDLFDALAGAGAASADRLEAARGPLERSVGDVRAESVREVYLEHLDSWLRYMRAVEEDPTLLGPERDDSARYTLSINATADAFARSLEDQLPDDADPGVQRMAEQLLDRGFRSQGDADV